MQLFQTDRQTDRTDRSALQEELRPGVDAVLAAEGVFDGQAAVVELQGGEAALVQTHHLPVGQGVAVGAVA